MEVASSVRSMQPALPDLSITDLSRHASSVRGLARALVGDEHLAEDIVQDAWLRALRSPGSSQASVGRWLPTIVRRLAQNQRRAAARRADHEGRFPGDVAQESHALALERLEVQREVLEQVVALREPYRTAIYLRYWEGLEPQTISERLGVPTKTVKTRLARALVELRERLDSRHGGQRERWLGALVPFAFPDAPALGAAAATGGIAAGVLIVKQALFVIVALGLALLAWQYIGGERNETLATSAASPSVEPPSAERAPAGPPALTEEDAPASERTPVASPPPRESDAVTGSLVVHLEWEDGTPTSDVAIDAVCAGDPAPRTEFFHSRTNEHGEARFDELFVGTVELTIDRGTFFSAEVVAAEERTIAFVVPRGCAVEGLVVDEPGGEPIAGAEIWIESSVGRMRFAHRITHSRADGTFQVNGLGQNARIGARARGHRPSRTFGVLRDLPEQPNGVRPVTLQLLTGGGSVGGVVLDPTGKPVAGAVVRIGERVVLLGSDSHSYRTVAGDSVPVLSNVDGSFEYPGGLSAGTALVYVSARGWPVWSGSVEVREGERARMEIVLQESGTIEGRVVDSEDRPIEGAEVHAGLEEQWWNEPIPPPVTESDATGGFVLRWVAPGDCVLHASAPRREELGRARATVSCIPGETRTVELRLDPGPAIRGRVVDEEGQALAGWYVWGEPIPDGGVAGGLVHRTHEGGNFVLPNLDPASTYRVCVGAPTEVAGMPRAKSAEVSAATDDLVIVVERQDAPDARLRGRLLGADGTVPTGIETYVCSLEGSMMYPLDVDPESGGFDHGPLFPGRYSLEVRRGPERLLMIGIEIVPGRTLDVGVLRLVGPGRLELDLQEAPHPGVEAFRFTLDCRSHADGGLVGGYEGDSQRFEVRSGGVHSQDLLAGVWMLRLRNGPWFLRDREIEIREGETTRVSLRPEPGIAVTVGFAFSDPEASWESFTYELRDASGEVLMRDEPLPRSRFEMRKARLRRFSLPAGEYVLSAETDGGQRVLESLSVSEASASEPPRVLYLR